MTVLDPLTRGSVLVSRRLLLPDPVISSRSRSRHELKPPQNKSAGYVIGPYFSSVPKVNLSEIFQASTSRYGMSLQRLRDCSSSTVVCIQRTPDILSLPLPITAIPTCSSNSTVMAWSTLTIAWSIAPANLGELQLRMRIDWIQGTVASLHYLVKYRPKSAKSIFGENMNNSLEPNFWPILYDSVVFLCLQTPEM